MEPVADRRFDYRGAVQRIAELQAGCGSEVNPVCRPILLDHGERTAGVVVWFHGYTNCPRQFEALGRKCFEAGYNVYIPLAPAHGLADRMTRQHARITSETLGRFAEESVDIAHGLGQRIAVGGMSMGGTLASWLAARRADIDLALPIAPVYSPFSAPLWLARLFAFALRRAAPNIMIWWNAAKKKSISGPQNAYYRYSLRGIGHIMRLAFETLGSSAKREPAAGRLHFVLNDNDEAIDNSLAKSAVSAWRMKGTDRVDLTVFPRELGLIHDLIDPLQRQQKVDLVYPVLLDILRREMPI